MSVKDCNVTWLFSYVKLIENVIHIQVGEMSSTIQFVSSFFNDRNDVPSAPAVISTFIRICVGSTFGVMTMFETVQSLGPFTLSM